MNLDQSQLPQDFDPEPNQTRPEQLGPDLTAEGLIAKSASARRDLGFGGKERLNALNNYAGLSWLLIVLALVLLVFAVNMFRQPVVSDNSGLPGQGNIGGSLEPTPDTRQSRVYTVSYRNGVFSPTNLRIHAGDTVRFKNESIFSIRIIGDDLVGFDSVGDIPQGSFFSFTFAAKGIFSYYNDKNSSETATIMVR